MFAGQCPSNQVICASQLEAALSGRREQSKRPYSVVNALGKSVQSRHRCSHACSVVKVTVPHWWRTGDVYLLPSITGVMSTGFWPVFRPRYPLSHCHIANVCEGTRLAAQKGRPGHAYFLLDKEQPTDAQDFFLRYAATQVTKPPNLTSSTH